MSWNGTAVLAGTLTVASGLTSWLLLDAATPGPPKIREPGVIALALVGRPAVRGPVQANLELSASDNQTRFQVVLSAFADRHPAGQRVGVFLCGPLANEVSVGDMNRGPIALKDVPSTHVEFDGQLGALADCRYGEGVIGQTHQLLLQGRFANATSDRSGDNIAYSLPGLVTTSAPYTIGTAVARPLPRGSKTEVSLSNPPSDLTIAAARPQLSAAGDLSWSAQIGTEVPTREVAVRGTLIGSSQSRERTLFAGGALVGVCGGAFIWMVEELFARRERRPAKSVKSKPHTE